MLQLNYHDTEIKRVYLKFVTRVRRGTVSVTKKVAVLNILWIDFTVLLSN